MDFADLLYIYIYLLLIKQIGTAFSRQFYRIKVSDINRIFLLNEGVRFHLKRKQTKQQQSEIETQAMKKRLYVMKYIQTE